MNPGLTVTTVKGILAFAPGEMADGAGIGGRTRVRTLAGAEENEIPRLRKGKGWG